MKGLKAIKAIKVRNMTSERGNNIANQFYIRIKDLILFQSYNSIIAVKDLRTGRTTLDRSTWDYSVTTGKYRNQFLGESKKETEAKIKSGQYKLADLN